MMRQIQAGMNECRSDIQVDGSSTSYEHFRAAAKKAWWSDGGLINAFYIGPYVNSRGARVETDLADKVGHVEGGHDEDGEPLPQGVVADLRLQAGEETQGDAVGDADGQHVGPDHAGDHVAMQDHVCRGRKRKGTHTHTHEVSSLTHSSRLTQG